MRRIFVSFSLAALLVAGCGQIQGTSGEAAPAAAIDKGKVTPDALKAAVTDAPTRAFYAKRNWQPVWTDDLAAKLEAAFGEAERHAINPAAYRKLAGEGATAAEREAGLTRAALDYARALAGGIVDPTKIYEIYEVPRPKVDVAGGLAGAVESGDVAGWLASLAPSDPEYKALSDAYLVYRRKAQGQQAGAPIEFGGKIERGDKDKRVPQIVAALRTNGYLAPEPPPDPKAKQGKAPLRAAGDLYTAEIAAGVARLQADYGIEPDGIVGDDTIEALSIGPADRARILAVNLERRRWLERTPAPTRIDVNTAGTFLTYWRDGMVAHQARVVVGQPEWETPELASPIVRLVANPPWTVPESIAEKEILPKGSAYMAREHIVMKNGKLVQEPGPKSALGLVKFDMANRHQIYLHDTPAKALFAADERHSSHGCARVEDALGFARLLAADQGLSEDFEDALATEKETEVKLKSQIPVRLLYHTAYVEGGRVLFRTDPYGWDDKLAEALGLGKQVRRRVRTHVEDIGP
jgi:murein L,D-transpeptidase YcbB/YkuD